MLKIIRNLLKQIVDDIDTGNTHIDYEDQCKILKLMSNLNISKEDKTNEEMNKTRAAEYLGMSRAKFDNYISLGLIPKGQKVGDFKELRWYKSDLDLYQINNKQ